MIAELLCAAYVALAMPNADIACKNMEHVVKSAEENDILPSVVVALIFVESRWTPKALSRDGACGLTQILPRYSAGYRKRFGKKLTCRQLFHPRVSISRGIKILAYYLDKYRGRYRRSLCSYNAGASRCRPGRKKNKGHRYAKKVLKIALKLRKKMREVEMEGYTDDDVPGCYE